MDPVAVLASLDQLGGTLPRTLVVGCQPGDVDERIGLTAPVSAAIDTAITTIHQILADVLSGQPVGANSHQEV
jgi:hydrogenase maturation protease